MPRGELRPVPIRPDAVATTAAMLRTPQVRAGVSDPEGEFHRPLYDRRIGVAVNLNGGDPVYPTVGDVIATASHFADSIAYALRAIRQVEQDNGAIHAELIQLREHLRGCIRSEPGDTLPERRESYTRASQPPSPGVDAAEALTGHPTRSTPGDGRQADPVLPDFSGPGSAGIRGTWAAAMWATDDQYRDALRVEKVRDALTAMERDAIREANGDLVWAVRILRASVAASTRYFEVGEWRVGDALTFVQNTVGLDRASIREAMEAMAENAESESFGSLYGTIASRPGSIENTETLLGLHPVLRLLHARVFGCDDWTRTLAENRVAEGYHDLSRDEGNYLAGQINGARLAEIGQRINEAASRSRLRTRTRPRTAPPTNSGPYDSGDVLPGEEDSWE